MRWRLVVRDREDTVDDRELLVDEVITQSECEREGGEFCYMHPKTQPKPAKPVKPPTMDK